MHSLDLLKDVLKDEAEGMAVITTRTEEKAVEIAEKSKEMGWQPRKLLFDFETQHYYILLNWGGHQDG